MEYVDAGGAWLESLGTGISRHDPATWTPPQWPPSYRGIINTLEVAHQDFVWRMRRHPRLLQARAASSGTPVTIWEPNAAAFQSLDAEHVLGADEQWTNTPASMHGQYRQAVSGQGHAGLGYAGPARADTWPLEQLRLAAAWAGV